MGKTMRDMFKRDAEIARLYRNGVSRAELAGRYCVSVGAIDQAIRKAETEEQQARDTEMFSKEFRSMNDIGRVWPCGRILEYLGFDMRSRKAIAGYFTSHGRADVSMTDIMDLIIPRPTGNEKYGDLFAVLPASRICNIGKYSYSRIMRQLNRLDLGAEFKQEWESRKSDVRGLLNAWGYNTMKAELAEKP